MNEIVTNKTPKRRRWIARLLVSALCILLASSLLFVGVVADTITLTAQFSSSYPLHVSYTQGCYYLSSSIYVYAYSGKLYFCDGSSVLSTVSVSTGAINSFYISGDYLYHCSILNSSSSGICPILSEINISDISSPSVVRTRTLAKIKGYASGKTPVVSFVIYDGLFCGLLFHDNSTSNSLCYSFVYDLGDGSQLYAGSLSAGLNFRVSNNLYAFTQSCFVLDDVLCSLSAGKVFSLVSYAIINTFSAQFSSVFFYEDTYYAMSADTLYRYVSSSRSFEIVGSSPLVPVTSYVSNGVLTCITSNGSNGVLPYTVYTGLPTTEPPPESSDETTEEPPPDESFEPDEPGTLNIYRTDIDRSGGVMVFNSTLDTSIPSDGLESLSAFLGYYWDADSSVRPPPSYMYLWANYEDGTRQRYDFDFSAYGYALGSDFAQNFYYPDYLGMEFEIPLNGDTDIYFVTSSPGGSVPVENSDGRIITLNFGSISSYARIDFVDESNYRITLYNNDMAIGNSLTFDQGVYRYLFVYNVDSVVNTWYYPEPGTSTLINYDKVENGLYNVVLTLNDKIPDYGKPGDFEDAVSRYEEIEGAVSSTMSETWEYLESLQEELNGSFDIVEFSEANAKLDQILSTPGGDTIFTFFRSLWGINPFLPTFAVMTVCFAGVAFIIRKI